MTRKLTRQQEWRRKNPASYLAHLTVQNALRLGLIQRQPCAICGAERAEAHHPRYDQPLVVEWLCRRHHRQHHAKEAANGQQER